MPKNCDFCGNSGQCYECNPDIRLAMDIRMKKDSDQIMAPLLEYRRKRDEIFNTYLKKSVK